MFSHSNIRPNSINSLKCKKAPIELISLRLAAKEMVPSNFSERDAYRDQTKWTILKQQPGIMTSATQQPHGFVLNVGHEAEARLIILWVTISYWLQGRGSDTDHDLFLKNMLQAVCIDRMDCYPFFLITFRKLLFTACKNTRKIPLYSLTLYRNQNEQL